jgi:ubiquinol-cytochrome c reductase cytochrome b subunit
VLPIHAHIPLGVVVDLLCSFVETITGLILMIWYAPTPERAYTDMIRLLSNVPFGQLMRDLHRLGAEMMVLIVTAHMVRTYLTGSYKAPRQFTWFTGSFCWW